MKKVILLILAGIISLQCTGCMKLVSHEKLAKKMLEERYNDSFEIKKVQGSDWLEGYFTVTAYQTDQPEILFEASVDMDGSQESDNYVCKLLAKKLSDQVTKNLEDLKGTSYVFSATVTDDVLLTDPAISLEKYMQEHPYTQFNIYFNYCPDNETMTVDGDAFYQALNHMLDGLECVSGNIYVYVTDEGVIEDIKTYRKTYDKCYNDYFQKMDPYYWGTVEFKNGRITSTKEEIWRMIEDKKK